jgi:hypothetical protein
LVSMIYANVYRYIHIIKFPNCALDYYILW